jgi:hypothetical protein
MTKKKETIQPTKSEIQSEPKNDLPWTFGQWGGFKQWRCKFCAFDTLDGEEVMRRHIIERHAPPPGQEPLIPIYNIYGNRIN